MWKVGIGMQRVRSAGDGGSRIGVSLLPNCCHWTRRALFDFIVVLAPPIVFEFEICISIGGSIHPSCAVPYVMTGNITSPSEGERTGTMYIPIETAPRATVEFLS